MAKRTIDIGKKMVSEVFSDWYSVPSYQRHYVWTEDNVNALLDDVKDNYLEHSDDEYFLGSYIIQKRNDRDTNDLLDGQQRITTLFLLFAFLRDYDGTPQGVKDDLQEFVYQKANIVRRIEERVRLSYEIRGTVQKFIQKYIVKENSISGSWGEFVEKASDAKENESVQHICRTLLCFKEYFEENTDIDIVKFVQYICGNVVMIHISADTLEDAFRLFSIMNDRGLKLSNADILKSSNLEHLKSSLEMDDYARKWEELQYNLGADFDRFLSYMRTLYAKTKVKVNLLDEFKAIFKSGALQQGKPFFEAVLEWYKVYEYVIELEGNDDVAYCNFVNVVNASKLSTDWVPVTMRYYERFGTNKLLEFVQKLIHKAVADVVCGETPSKRIENMNKFLTMIERASKPEDVLNNDTAFAFNTDIFLARIQSDMYGRLYARMLLLLLEYKYQDNSVAKTFTTISIEHILPQNPKTESEWMQLFTEEERIATTHKIGNLCIIGRRKNSSLGNKDYKEKLEKYFSKNIANFARSLTIYHKYPTQWTPAEYEECMKQTVNDIREIFGV